MEDYDPMAFLIFALKHFDLKIVEQKEKTIYIENNYSVEVEGKKLFKLMHDGQVISPFTDVEELCIFIKKDMELNEKG